MTVVAAIAAAVRCTWKAAFAAPIKNRQNM